MILFINACIRHESRTRRLAETLLTGLGDYEEVNLQNSEIFPLNEENLIKRSQLIEAGNYNDAIFDYAKQFASADTIVIAAPYWDGSFPAVLKVYLENIYVTGIVSRYGDEGGVIGLCKADKLYYITTSGGPYIPDYSYTYLQHLSKEYFGISETYLFKAEMLDVDGFDSENILRKSEDEINNFLYSNKS